MSEKEGKMKGAMSHGGKTGALERRRDDDEAAVEPGHRGWIDVEEARKQLKLAVPMVLTNIAGSALHLVGVMFAGHLGDLELAGATLANSWGTVTGFALTMGLSGALETLCGQSYGGKQYKMLGIYLQSATITSAVFCAAIAVLWWFTEPVLLCLGQDPAVAGMAAQYLRYLIPGLFGHAFLQCILRYLQAQSVVLPLVVCSVVPLAVHAGLTYLLMYPLGLGFKAAPISGSAALWLSFVMLAVYVGKSDEFEHTWEGLSPEAFRLVLPTVALAVPSAVGVCLEEAAFEVLVLLAGLMPNSQLSTSIVAMCANTEAIAYMITCGFGATASTRVSNEIGAGNVGKAKNAVGVALRLSAVLAVTVALMLAVRHRLWAGLFTESAGVIAEFAGMTPFLAGSILVDSFQGILSGVCRGCGWQRVAAIISLVAFYVVGMPVAVLLGFRAGLHSKGLWLGLIGGLLCQSAALLVITVRTKWERMSMATALKEERVHLLA